MLVALGANALLLALKAGATGISDSLTIFSETLNSLSDFLGAIIVVVFVTWAHRSNDADHPFGHGRAEPIAGLVLALFTAILGFEVVRSVLMDWIEPSTRPHVGWAPIAALVVAGLVKSALAIYFRRLGRELDSPAFRASAIDSRNDVLVAAQAVLALILVQVRWEIFDSISALLVGLYILYSAFHIAMENIDYLMGKAPDHRLCERIRAAAENVRHVQQVDDLKAHYVGTRVHVELTTRVDGGLSTVESHDIAEEVREAVESIHEVDRAFVHVEPAK